MRANCTLATSAQAMSRTNATAPMHKIVYWREVAGHELGEWHRAELPALICVRVSFRLALRDSLHLRGSFRKGDVRLQPAQDPQPASVASLAVFAIERQRSPGLCWHGEVEAFWHDPHNGVGFAADFDVLA